MPSTRSSHIEGRMALAIDAYHSGRTKSIRATAQAYSVPRSTLQTRLRGTPCQRDTRPKACKLTAIEEDILLQRILDQDARGFPPRYSVVEETANILLASRDSATPITVGKLWSYNFVRRQPLLAAKYNRRYDYQRALCEDPVKIGAWFTSVKDAVTKYGILEDDIYNFDETGFAMGMITTAKVITGADKKGRARTIQPGNREWVTITATINAMGWQVPPFVIFAGKHHQSTWYETPGLPRSWKIAVSTNGWTNDQLGLEWLQHFDTHTKARTRGTHRLLILDGHGSHSTTKFEDYCAANGIIPLCMPPHSSHILQPLDVSCFGPLKKAYGKRIEGLMRLGVNHIDKADFLRIYIEVQDKAMSQSNIKGGFRAAGLVPYNPQRVLADLTPLYRTPSPLIVDEDDGLWSSKTPKTITQIHKQSEYIQRQRRLRSQLSHSPSEGAYRQLLKGFEVAIHERAILAKEVEALRAENNKQKRKRSERRSYVGKGGVLSAGEGQDRVSGLMVEEGVVEEAQNGAPPLQRPLPATRAPNRCSMCRSLSHVARTCPNPLEFDS
jgi:hypothetical protein